MITFNLVTSFEDVEELKKALEEIAYKIHIGATFGVYPYNWGIEKLPPEIKD